MHGGFCDRAGIAVVEIVESRNSEYLYEKIHSVARKDTTHHHATRSAAFVESADLIQRAGKGCRNKAGDAGRVASFHLDA